MLTETINSRLGQGLVPGPGPAVRQLQTMLRIPWFNKYEYYLLFNCSAVNTRNEVDWANKPFFRKMDSKTGGTSGVLANGKLCFREKTHAIDARM